MCLVLCAINQHPQFPLIILSNRDEFYQRSSMAADYWPDQQRIFAGQDLVKHGTWLGVNRGGRVALVTNYRDPVAYRSSMMSRGLLVRDYLASPDSLSTSAYLEQVDRNVEHYNAFNLLLGTPGELYYYASRTRDIKKLEDGLYGLSNALLDTPWYKVERAKNHFRRVQNDLSAIQDRNIISERLYPILLDTQQAPEHDLPDTGVGPVLETWLSSAFINIEGRGYGTVCSSILMFDKNGIAFFEKNFLDARLLSSNEHEIRTNSTNPVHGI